MKKRYIIGLVLCCLMIIPLVGCSKGDDTGTKATPRTPMQLVNDRVNASDAINTRQDLNLFDLSNRITNEVSAITQVDLGPLNARIGVLESLGFSEAMGNLSFLATRVTSLESYNIASRLTAIEIRLNASATPTPTPSGSATPTPTATPVPTTTPNCTLVTKPVANYPLNGCMSVPNTHFVFEWSECNANYYELYFGNNSNTMSLLANTGTANGYIMSSDFYADSYYFWKVVAVSPCGNKSSSWWFKTQ